MVNKILCATRNGIGGEIVEVQATFVRALPAFVITGLANNAIQESKQRIQSALNHINFTFPPLKIAVHLSPADIAKSGSHFDLPIALLIALQKQGTNASEEQKWFAFGELGLDGEIRHSEAIYPLLLEVSLLYPNAKVIVPKEGENLFCHIPNLRLFYASSLKDALELIQNADLQDDSTESAPKPKSLDFASININGEEFYHTRVFSSDFAQVRGQEIAKRAALIAASGMHNIIFEGSPGCGKSMIAKRMREILPPMSLSEIIQCVRLQAISGQKATYSPLRPFRNPHQSASKSSILGSATQSEAKPGEIALAHNGILFFDELPHFSKEVLEALREPLENNELVISRVHSKIAYPTSFLFVGAQNPCPCGNLLSLSKECRCSQKEIASYRARLSEPFLDRIDMFIQMQENEQDAKPSITSAQMQEAVFGAYKAQIKRGQIHANGKLNEKEIEEFCTLSEESQRLLLQAAQRFSLSHRSIQKLKKLSRTIADLDAKEEIGKSHLLEALNYRRVG